MASIVWCAIADPLTNHIDRWLIEEWPALWHAVTVGGRALKLLNDVTVGGIVRFDPVDRPYLEAWHVNQRRKAVCGARQVHARWQKVARGARVAAGNGAGRREYLRLDH